METELKDYISILTLFSSLRKVQFVYVLSISAYSQLKHLISLGEN